MKKLLSLVIICIFIVMPMKTYAAFGTGWNATSTTQGWIFPNLINGVIQSIAGRNFIATSTTATSTFAGGFTAADGKFTVDRVTGVTTINSTVGAGSGGGLILNANTASPATVPHSGAIHIMGADSDTAALYIDSFGVGAANAAQRAIINLRHANGTGALPTAGLSGQEIARVASRSHDGTDFTGSLSAFGFHLAEDTTTTAQGSYITIKNTAIGTKGGGTLTVPPEVTRFQPSGGMSVGTTTFNATDPGQGKLTVENAIGIGSTTPYGKFAISGTAGAATTTFLVNIASSTNLVGGPYFTISSRGTAMATGRAVDPQIISGTQGTTPGTTLQGAFGIFVQGKYAYVANATRDSLAVIDISDPTNPTFIAETQGPTPGTSLDGASKVHVAGKYAYVTNSGRDSLAVIDISNPFLPTWVADTMGATPGTTLDGAFGVYVQGKYAYVTTNTRDSLAVIDISVPTAPRFVGETQGPTPGTSLNGASGIFVSGQYAYVTNNAQDSLAIIDISKDSAPLFLSEIQGPTPNTSLDGARQVIVSGKYAYVVTLTRDSLAIIDVSNPLLPTWVAETQGPTPGTSLNAARGLFLSGKYAYITNGTQDSLAVVDISVPTAPTWVAEATGTTTTANASLDGPIDVFVSGKYAYVANNVNNSMAVVDIGGLETSTLLAGNIQTDRLLVGGQTSFNNNVSVGGGLNVGLGGINSNGPISSYVASTTASVLTSAIFMGGNVGVGTTTPVGKLTVTNDTSNLSLIVEDSASTDATPFVIDASGNVGIGTTTPLTKLENVCSDAGTTLTTVGTCPIAVTNSNTTVNNFQSYLFNQFNSLGARITSSAISSVNTDHTAASEDSDLSFLTMFAGTLSEKFRILSGGNVGVGTSTPFGKLSVSGGDLVVAGHINTATSTAPVASGCGTSPSVSGSDVAGKYTVGTVIGVDTSCVMTFNTPYVTAPACMANNESQILLTRAVSTATTVTFSVASAYADSDVISYICIAGK